MSKEVVDRKAQILIVAGLLGLAAVLIYMFLPIERKAFVSVEVEFTDVSPAGLKIMPASCAADPSMFHSPLIVSADGKGYQIPDTSYGLGAYNATLGMYVCATNITNTSYYIPAGSVADLAQFKAATANNWTYCAGEGQTCYVSGTKVVRYGNGVLKQYTYKNVTGSILCSPVGFQADPALYYAKDCYYASTGAPGLVSY